MLPGQYKNSDWKNDLDTPKNIFFKIVQLDTAALKLYGSSRFIMEDVGSITTACILTMSQIITKST